MRFTKSAPRRPPAVILISLIDILMVLLIFLTATTTFKRQPAIQLTLPQSSQATEGSSEGNLIVTVAKEPPHLFLGSTPVTHEKLRQEMRAAIARDPGISLSIRIDTDAPFGEFLRVTDTAKELRVAGISVITQKESSSASQGVSNP